MTSTTTILRLQEVINRTGLGRATLYTRMKQGNFPKAIQLSKRAVGWIDIEIEEWIQSRIYETRGSAGGADDD